MNYCKNCNKAIEKKENIYNGLCFNCYKIYLYEKIDNFEKNHNNPIKSNTPKTNHFIDFFKKIFKHS